MTIEEKEKYLMKASFNAKDIAELTGLKGTRVTVIMKECKLNFGGLIKNRPNAIKASSFWKWTGSSIEEEYRLLGIAKGYGQL